MERPSSVVVYARTELPDALGGREDIDGQQQACSGAATRLGAEVVAAFVDVGFGGRTLDRPGLTHLLGWLDYPGQEPVDYVAVASPDRLAEGDSHLGRIYFELGRRGVRLLLAETDTVVDIGISPIALAGAPDVPAREQVEDYEIDLTGVVRQPDSLVEVIRDAITEAGQDGEVPEWGARAMARFLANVQDAGPTALHQFAVTGRIDTDRIAQELTELWRSGDRTRLQVEAIDRLGSYLIDVAHRERKVMEENYSEATRALIVERGPAYAAFLYLPDVTEQSAPDLFYEASAGSFDSIDAIIASVVEDLELRQQLEKTGLDFAQIDPIKVLRLARERWDIVPYNDRYYLFDK